MKCLKMTVYEKDGSKWIETMKSDDVEYCTERLASLLYEKHLLKYQHGTLKDVCNYDGTRTLYNYYGNNKHRFKREYIVEDR